VLFAHAHVLRVLVARWISPNGTFEMCRLPVAAKPRHRTSDERAQVYVALLAP
jgi:hypothetical protein